MPKPNAALTWFNSVRSLAAFNRPAGVTPKRRGKSIRYDFHDRTSVTFGPLYVVVREDDGRTAYHGPNRWQGGL